MINFDTIEIMNIVVKKKYRRQGIGEKLLENLINMSKEMNFDSLNLEVNSKNRPALEMYKKFGFEQIGSRKKYYNNKDDAILMKKQLKNI